MKNNKRLISLLCAAALMLSLLTGCGNASASENLVTPKSSPRSNSSDTAALSTEDTQNASAPQTVGEAQTADSTAQTAEPAADITGSVSITEAQAKQIALEHAGFTEDEVTGLRAKLDQGHSSSEYDVEFYKDNVEYDYEIDANTGSILSYESDTRKDNGTQANISASITEAQARQIALEHAGFTDDQVTGLYAKLKQDNGKAEYDVEFYKDNTEYGYEIDANTGDILSYDAETNSGSRNTAAGVSVTEDQAKQTALEHAGLTEAEVNNLRVKLEKDDVEYDVTFKKDRTKYDYEIDAVTGDILSYDIEVE